MSGTVSTLTNSLTVMPLESLTVKSVELSVENSYEIITVNVSLMVIYLRQLCQNIICLFPNKQILTTSDKLLFSCCTAA